MAANIAQVFKALGDETRLSLFKQLAKHERICVSQLAEKLSVSPACVSQHMTILQSAGLVARSRQGQRVCYQIVSDSASKRLLGQIIFNTPKEEVTHGKS